MRRRHTDTEELNEQRFEQWLAAYSQGKQLTFEQQTITHQAFLKGSYVWWTLHEAAKIAEQVRYAGSGNERKALCNMRLVLDHFGRQVKLDDITTSTVDAYIQTLKDSATHPPPSTKSWR